MRAVVQRVQTATVTVKGDKVASINKGLLVFLGIGAGDSTNDLQYMVSKIAQLRAFQDKNGKMNLSLAEVQGEVLAVSQFTLFGDCRKGRRPSFIEAAPPEKAEELYEYFTDQIKKKGIPAQCGQFGAMMDVSLVNDGPVTLIIESR